MATATAASITPGTVSDRAAPAAPTQEVSKVNYLERCVEVITDKVESRNRFWANVHAGVAITTGVLFIASMIAAIVVTAIFAPPSIPFAALGAFCAFPFVQAFIAARQNTCMAYIADADKCRDIRAQLEAIPNTKEAVEEALRELDIDLNDIQDDAVKANPTLLRPLLAHYRYWKKQVDDQREKSTKLQEEIETLISTNPNNDKGLEELRLDKLAAQEASLVCKVRAAFYLGLLSNPSFSRMEKDVMEFGNTVDGISTEADLQLLGRRALATQYRDDRQETLVTITRSNGEQEPLERRIITAMGIDGIARELMA